MLCSSSIPIYVISVILYNNYLLLINIKMSIRKLDTYFRPRSKDTTVNDVNKQEPTEIDNSNIEDLQKTWMFKVMLM